MRVEQLGEGTPDVAVVAGIHGDEPCGPRAVERLLDEEPAVERAVKLVVANERALERGVRYVNEDLNRAFPGDPDGETYEQRVAHELLSELRGCTTLSLHSTQSYAEPFALVDRIDDATRSVCSTLPVTEVVETDQFANGRLITHPRTIEVECGLQGTDRAAENAYRLVRGFLDATGALPDAGLDDATGRGDVTVYRMLQPVPKDEATEYQVLVDNFEGVRPGETFAAVEGDEMVADEPFVPILMSAYGYEDIFGYTGERVGVLGD